MSKKKMFILPIVALLAACNSEPYLTKLKNNEVLVVGNNDNRFRNYTTIQESDAIITVPIGKVTYSLMRSTYNGGTGFANYGEYYYYFDISYPDGNESRNLGKKTVTKSTSYSYMPYGKDEIYIFVETTIKTKTEYSFPSRWENYSVTVNLELNGYFPSEQAFKAALPSLTSYTTAGNGKVYFDATKNETVSKTTNYFSTYYYIEKV